MKEMKTCFEMFNNIFNESQRFNPSMPSSTPLSQRSTHMKEDFQKLQLAEVTKYLKQLQLSIKDVSASVGKFNNFYQNHVPSESPVSNFFIVKVS